MKLTLGSVLKIMAAAAVVAPELIQAGKQTVKATKAMIKTPTAESVAAAEASVIPIVAEAGQLLSKNS